MERIVDNNYREWRQHNAVSRNHDLPAAIYFRDKEKYWCKKGKCHREKNLPANICEDEGKHWYKEGKRHREKDLPAIIWNSGKRHLYKEGLSVKKN